MKMEARIKRTPIFQSIRSCRDEILDFTKALVAVPTENPPGTAYETCVRLLTQKLDEIDLDSKIIKVPAAGKHPRYCIVSSHGKGKKTLYFHGHYDVVPGLSERQFRPFLRDGKLFGRGSSDMKGGLAAMIYAIKALKECGDELNGRIGLTIVPDEETGGALGSQYLDTAGLLGKDGIGMLTAEPTDGMIWNANRGAISMRVTVRGKPAHVGLHYQGVNAFEKMLTVANALLEFKRDVEKRRTMFNIEPDAARRSILLIGGQSEGGTNFNTVPAQASFTLDRRINPEEDLNVEKRELVTLLHRLRRHGLDLGFDILQEATSSGVSEYDPVARALAQSVQAVTGKPARFRMCPGVLEIRFYIKKGIPALAYGPGLLSVSHGPNEFVKVRQIHRCAIVYALTALKLLR